MCSLFLVSSPLHLTPTPNTVIKEIPIPSVLDCVVSPCNESYRRAFIAWSGLAANKIGRHQGIHHLDAIFHRKRLIHRRNQQFPNGTDIRGSKVKALG